MHSLKTVAILVLGPSVLLAQTQIPQREQTEQIRVPRLSLDQSAQDARTAGSAPSSSTGTDDAFGAQVILKERPDQRTFQTSLDTSAFYTDNVALTRNDRRSDAFLNSTLSLGWRRSLTDRLAASVMGSYGLFRYNRTSVLDFQNVNAAAALDVRLPGGVDLLPGYGFTQFADGRRNREFYTEHSLNLGVQRVFQLSRAHYLATGLSAQWTWADPEGAQRDRYSAWLAYHVRATEHLTGDLIYRYSFYDYRDGGTGRGDHNHSLSLSLRYDLAEWLAVSATAQAGWNRSNQSVFNYDALDLGGSVGLSARF